MNVFNTVSKYKEGFTARQIKGAEVARYLYVTLIYPSAKDYKWVICSNQIKNCPVTVHDAEVLKNAQGKKIAALKLKKTLRGPKLVSRNQAKIPVGLIILHKEVFITCDIFFMNKISFFLTLIQNVYFTAVNNLVNRIVP